MMIAHSACFQLPWTGSTCSYNFSCSLVISELFKVQVDTGHREENQGDFRFVNDDCNWCTNLSARLNRNKNPLMLSEVCINLWSIYNHFFNYLIPLVLQSTRTRTDWWSPSRPRSFTRRLKVNKNQILQREFTKIKIEHNFITSNQWLGRNFPEFSCLASYTFVVVTAFGNFFRIGHFSCDIYWSAGHR